ncbi:16S rRNA (uracil(1498)-N(3))-methyltransferase [Crocinitomix catalasitica]|uniref:16S rRNA (uracil(1498)-N(3))-methyltransferase n=1 Tax=Crocinitomix catalasitica TaxID=184607 RepID=UPI0004834757|nr:16S rRNA (uracil(1498)-N(3))-methyltransferase [Crocinitomix catalasitica]
MSLAKHSFFCENIDDCTLGEDESHHAVRVLRLKENQHITVINGTGRLVTAKITMADKKAVYFEIIDDYQQKLNDFDIHIAIAPTKNIDRFNFFLEKTIEIGISRITPILTSNSERKHLQHDKLSKQMLSALKQSGNLYIPVLEELTSLSDFFQNLNTTSAKFIAHCEKENEGNELREVLPKDKKVVILIGPEGDFTKEEINLAIENNFNPIKLGSTRLRTETAGIVACHTVHVI